MSGPAEVPAGAGGRHHRGRVWAGIMIGVLVVSGAVAAVIHGDGEDESAPDRVAPSPPDLPDPLSDRHEFPVGYTGPVWIVVDADDATPRTITIRWGPWERRIVHQSADPIAYEFAKASAESVPLTVAIDPGADLEFDQGEPPADAVDVNEGWVRVADPTSTTTTPTTVVATTTVPAG